MSQIDENQVHDRLKRLSQVEPGQEAANRAIQKARDALTGEQAIPKPHKGRLAPLRLRLPHFFVKLAAVAVLMIGAGFIGGQLSTPQPVNMQEFQVALESSLKSSLEPAIRQQLHDEFENRLQSALTAERNMLKQELAQQVHRDMETYAEQTLTTAGNLMDRRLMNFARMLEEARIKERRHVAAAFDYMGSRFGDGLVTLATRTNNLLDVERANPTPDVSEN
jgi:hypothetical protein